MKRFILCASVLALAGCATIVSGTTQDININTPGHPGAQCILTSQAIGSVKVRTPATAKLQRSRNQIKVSCSKGCYRGNAIIPSYVEAMAAGNIILGGLVGAGIDAASGALNRYESNNNIPMTRKRSCG